MTEDELFETFDTIGKAVGFALGAALIEGESLRTSSGLRAFSVALYDLTESERFTPDVTLVIDGIAAGLVARSNLDPDAPTLI